MTIKYHIEVADAYWPKRYGTEWEKADEEARRQLIADEFTRWENTLAGEANAGKTIGTRMRELTHTQELQSLVKLNALKLDLPDGAYVEDSNEADFHIVRGLGVDPPLVGISPSKNRQSSGSGSDKRVARTNYLLAERPHGQLLTAPLKVVAEVNGWNTAHNGGRPIQFMFSNLFAATLDRTQQVSADPAPPTNTPEDGTVQDDR